MNYRCGRRLGQEIVRMFLSKIGHPRLVPAKVALEKEKAENVKKNLNYFK